MRKNDVCAYLQQSTVPEWMRLCHRTWYRLGTEGIGNTLRFSLGKLIGTSRERPKGTPPLMAEVLDLHQGEVVEVRSAEEIRQTLDGEDKTRGLLFMAEMWKYCGERFIVYKRVNTILVESTGKKRRLKNTVLLQNVHCDGSEHFNCDSSCFHFWREAWLKRAETPDSQAV